MIRKLIVLCAFLLCGFWGVAQRSSRLSASAWVDSVFKTLSPDEKIAQLMVVRGSSFDPKTKRPILFTEEVQEAVRKYNIGGICMFQVADITGSFHQPHAEHCKNANIDLY